MPIISCAPMLAATKARPVIHRGTERPDRKNSSLDCTRRRSQKSHAKNENEVSGEDEVVDQVELHEVTVTGERGPSGREPKRSADLGRDSLVSEIIANPQGEGF